MKRPTEMQAMKRILYTYAHYDHGFTNGDANTIIRDSCVSALNGLDNNEYEAVRRNQDRLVMHVKGLGELGALELLAAIGDVLE